MSEEIEMLPCPFCGGKPGVKLYKKNGLHLRCNECLAGFRQQVIRNSLDWLRDQLVKDWNKRTSKQEVPNDQ